MPEFALVAPLLFLILFAIIQFGFTLGGQIGFTNGVREAARYASTLPKATAAQVVDELRFRSLPKAIPGFTRENFDEAETFDGVTTEVTYCAFENPNHTAIAPSYSIKVRITAVYNHSLIVPLVNVIVDAVDGTADGKLTAVVTEEMRVENPPLTTVGDWDAC